MTFTTTLRITAVGLLVACGLAPIALAGGEPKNDWPFTRHVGIDRTLARAQRPAQAAHVAGEPKNEWPFTRSAHSADRGLQPAPDVRAGYGETKNDAPFNQAIVAPGEIATGNDGFQWSDAGIGVAAGFGLALGLGGMVLLAGYRIPRVRKTGAEAG